MVTDGLPRAPAGLRRSSRLHAPFRLSPGDIAVRTPAGSYDSEMPAERVRLRIGSLANAVLVSGQAYQDPKDALNEFISNAADEYVQAGLRGERIRVLLRRKGRYPIIAVDDVGRGMPPERLHAVARNLFDSSKAGDNRTLGEKAIGILAFQQLGGRCEIASRVEGSSETWVLRLERGKATAMLERERRRLHEARERPSTSPISILTSCECSPSERWWTTSVLGVARRWRGVTMSSRWLKAVPRSSFWPRSRRACV